MVRMCASGCGSLLGSRSVMSFLVFQFVAARMSLISG